MSKALKRVEKWVREQAADRESKYDVSVETATDDFVRLCVACERDGKRHVIRRLFSAQFDRLSDTMKESQFNGLWRGAHCEMDRALNEA